MKERLWQALARFLSRERIANALIRYAMRTPYSHLPSNDDPSYMARYWVFNPYSRVTNKPRLGWLCPVSIRVHHIEREDTDQHLHDHPWNARTIILKGWYVEKRESARPGREFEFQIKRPGDTQALRFGEYHSIVEVADGGAWTLFFSSKWQGVWGFKVDGVKVPWRKHMGIEQSVSPSFFTAEAAATTHVCDYVPSPEEVAQALVDAERMNHNMRTYGTIDAPR